MFGGLIVFARFLIKSPKQSLGDLLFLLCFLLLFLFLLFLFLFLISYSYSFFPRSMNLSTADLRNYRTEFHETWWSYRYMFLADPKVFRFVVKGVKAIFSRCLPFSKWLPKHGIKMGGKNSTLSDIIKI